VAGIDAEHIEAAARKLVGTATSTTR